ncbi:SRPBCC family protein [Bradyrhizobium sp. U87765 SZCCT0131]|uniref:SRPBCC family protein n=1 Tax=unclassified Bradyrhizobium TaxID=2631580 RepID=UPI001BA67D9F|nr:MULTISPECIES: SRPBCC family protein [unclassified Bradyrhizobium]MBR1218789.1 SRPBCC family protein [Bradyrhizobium sp. U87765 SZCCT0131]MBR1265452.1 SRPBCC family protein [Bradyrhizobium sp. U87765 SZCCT0134]MBR1304288.1 SRPBCC family protein [Bradyrhizobium sp. U87765 SZCCT0110]MBR1319893.1 SRPBCC family protein [Bradyrhizobium sp. U87765 SZCCT0109]MBR1348219.1 SRPBCC family protein [Bradyrhizobium sp. U87765 SZCCT0048]
MGSVHKEFSVAAPADRVWAALADFGALATRLVPGFVTACRLEDEHTRIVTFSNGTEAREILVDCDAARRRLVYVVVGGQLTQHSASAQVLAEGDGACRFVWVADFLPNALADYVAAQMELGAMAMKAALEKEAAAVM